MAQRAAHRGWHRDDARNASLHYRHTYDTLIPVDILQSEVDHLAVAQPEFDHANGRGVLAAALRRVPVKRSEQLLPLGIGKSALIVALAKVGHLRHGFHELRRTRAT